MKEIRETKINNGLIKDRIIRDVRTLFDQVEEKAYYKPKRVSNFWNNNYIESSADKNRNLSLDEYLNKIKPYLRNIIIDLQSSDTWKNQLTFFLQKMLKKSL